MRKDKQQDSSQPGERLQKVLAAAGVGSRRDCEELIRDGRISVDKKVVTELGTRVDPLAQEIRVDGEVLRKPQRLYYVVNKPVGVVTTNDDPAGRERVVDLVPTEERVFAVGRLDRSSEGLILVTNDGEFANRITHPRYGVEKTYAVRVAGSADPKGLARLRKGVHLAEGFAKAQAITVKKKHGQSTDLVIVLNEGRNREIRRILARVGHKVLNLKRIAVGPIKLADLPVGGWRRLMPAEVELLLSVAKEKRRAAKAGVGSRGSGVGKQRKQETGDKGQGTEPYLQKRALLSEPLSLDDLLRDDLDDAIVGGPEVEEGPEGVAFETTGPEGQGGVIDYEDEASPSPPPGAPPANAPPRRPGKPGRFPQRPDGQGGAKPSGRPAGKPGFRAKHAKKSKNFQHKQRRGGSDGGFAKGGRLGKAGGRKGGGKQGGGKQGGRGRRG
jgi:23S rRNA pseudouridine2605 synthase